MSADAALVGVVMGSDSDWPVMRAAAEALPARLAKAINARAAQPLRSRLDIL